MSGNLPLPGKSNLDVYLGVKRGKIREFHFRLKLDLQSYFDASCALQAGFEMFDNFNHILILLRPLKNLYEPDHKL